MFQEARLLFKGTITRWKHGAAGVVSYNFRYSLVRFVPGCSFATILNSARRTGWPETAQKCDLCDEEEAQHGISDLDTFRDGASAVRRP